MKAIKDCKLNVNIELHNFSYGNFYSWEIYNGEYFKNIIGICEICSYKYFKTRVGAIKSFKTFAKLNGIENYSIKEN